MFLKQRLQAGEVVRGSLHLIPSAFATQAVAAAGADFVIIDREHGPIGRETLHAMIAATAGTGCSPLVRVPVIDEAEVKLALDAGAEGIVYPLVRSAADAELAVALMTYPPAGRRGWAPFAAAARFGVNVFEYASAVAPQLTCCLLIETAEAVADIEAIAAVPGVDLIVIAQFDLSTGLGCPGDFTAPVFLDAVAKVEQAVKAQGIPLGAIALTQERSAELVEQGYLLLMHGFDVAMLAGQVASWKDWT